MDQSQPQQHSPDKDQLQGRLLIPWMRGLIVATDHHRGTSRDKGSAKESTHTSKARTEKDRNGPRGLGAAHALEGDKNTDKPEPEVRRRGVSVPKHYLVPQGSPDDHPDQKNEDPQKYQSHQRNIPKRK